MHMKPESKPAYNALTEALAHTVPDCDGDERFTEDLLENGDKRVMGEICSACPLLDFCLDFALTEKPRGGAWPGVQLRITRKAVA